MVTASINEKSCISILIADDHAMIREGVKNLLSRDGLCLYEASTGREALSQYQNIRPQLTIMDISLPGINGMEATQEIFREDPAAKIIILSMYDDESYISQCLEYGVKGYVVKSEASSELEYAVSSVLAGRSYFSTQAQQTIFRKYTRAVEKKKVREAEFKLTAREVEIVRLIAEGLTSSQMADKLFISPRTVDTHRANLMKKTGSKNSIDLVKKLEQAGII